MSVSEDRPLVSSTLVFASVILMLAYARASASPDWYS
jgi:hypothetical protein